MALACPAELLPEVERQRRALEDVPGARILDTEGLHVTVIYPWDERDPQAVLRDFSAIDSGPVTLTFDRADFRVDGPRGGVAWIQAESTPATERLWLQAWRAIKSHDPPFPPLPHVTVARFPVEAAAPELPAVEPVTVTLDRLCLYESEGNLSYRTIGERRLA